MPTEDASAKHSTPAETVRAVADHLAGRWVQLTWATRDGVWESMVTVLGVALVDGADVVLRVGIPVEDDGEIDVYVGWHDLLDIWCDPAAEPPSDLLERITTASRWFGRRVEITQRNHARIVGEVTGFDVNDDGSDVDVILVPGTDRPPESCEYLVGLDDIETLVVLDT